MTLVTSLIGDLKFIYASTVGGTAFNFEPSIVLNDALATGTTADKADLLYVAKDVALSGSATTNVDVAGSLVDAFGATVTAVKIKVLTYDIAIVGTSA